MKAVNLLSSRPARLCYRFNKLATAPDASILPYHPSNNYKYHQQRHHIHVESKNETEDKNVVKAAVMNVPIPNVPFSKYVWSRIDKWSDATALVCGVTEKELKYNELRELCSKFAAVLQNRLGLAQGQVLAVILPNCLEYVSILFGAIEAGVAPSPINVSYTPAEIGHQLRDSGAKAIVTTSEKILDVKQACFKFGLKDVKIIALGATNDLPPDVLNYEKLMTEAFPSENHPIFKNEQETVFIPYSSGTSGLPKGVCLSNRNLLANLLNWNSTNSCQQTTNEWQEVIPLILPFFHIYGFAILGDSIYNGAKLIILPRLIENLFIRSLTHYKASLLYVVPPMVFYMSGSSKFGPNEFKSLRTVVSGAAPMSSQDVNIFLTKVKQPVRFSQGYGATETSPMITDMSTSTENRDSVGRPVLNTMMKVVDTITGETLGPGQTGELHIKGPQVMTGYLNKPEETRQALDSNSWYHSNDIGHYNEDGLFFVTDRLKDMIKVKGFQVAPAEVEAALRSHPSIADAAVVGGTDSKHGETPIAFVKLTEKGKMDVNALKAHLSEFLVKYKIPSKFVEVESIPKSASGKILRKDLKHMLIS